MPWFTDPNGRQILPIRFRQSVATAWLEITVRDRLNRQVRRMTVAVGHPTWQLLTVAIAQIVQGDRQPGRRRGVTQSEIKQMYSVTTCR